jgi:alkylhydroperoxidase/carboxymuconolactone decarboxylase family protein YurZ
LSSLDPKTLALTRLAALVSSDPVAVSQEWGVGVALAMGASDQEVVAVLMAVAPLIGAAKTIIVATELALALGCEIDLLD